MHMSKPIKKRNLLDTIRNIAVVHASSADASMESAGNTHASTADRMIGERPDAGSSPQSRNSRLASK
jgi:hypothetical protein